MAENKEVTDVIEKPKQAFSVVLSESLDEVADALPKDFNKTRFVQNCVALLNDNDTLRTYASTYGTNNIKLGMLKASYLGVDFINKECYLIPYGKTLNFMLDYRGNVKLCMKYSARPIKDIYAKLVREGDFFEEKIVDGQPTIDFKPLAFNTGKIIGAFAVCLFKDGGLIYDTMNLEELEQTRKSSKMSGGATWKNFTGEMYKKTVLHRLCKHIQIDFDTPEQRKYFDEDMQADFEPEKPKKASLNDVLNEDDVIDAEVVE